MSLDKVKAKAAKIEITALLYAASKAKNWIVEDCVFMDPGNNNGIYVDCAAKGHDPQLIARGVAIMRAETGHLLDDLRNHERAKPRWWRMVRSRRWRKARTALVDKLAVPFKDSQGAMVAVVPQGTEPH